MTRLRKGIFCLHIIMETAPEKKYTVAEIQRADEFIAQIGSNRVIRLASWMTGITGIVITAADVAAGNPTGAAFLLLTAAGTVGDRLAARSNRKFKKQAIDEGLGELTGLVKPPRTVS